MAKRTVDKDLDTAHERLHKLAEVGLEIDRVTDELLDEGVARFSDSYRKLIENLGQKANRARVERVS